MDNSEYKSLFHYVVTSGWICGLINPIEIAVNAHRTPGGTLSNDYYKRIERFLPRFLCEIYEYAHYVKPIQADDVLAFIDDHYKHNTMCQGYFNFLKDRIQQYIDENPESGE